MVGVVTWCKKQRKHEYLTRPHGQFQQQRPQHILDVKQVQIQPLLYQSGAHCSFKYLQIQIF
jgi:hypothetical protein